MTLVDEAITNVKWSVRCKENEKLNINELKICFYIFKLLATQLKTRRKSVVNTKSVIKNYKGKL